MTLLFTTTHETKSSHETLQVDWWFGVCRVLPGRFGSMLGHFGVQGFRFQLGEEGRGGSLEGLRGCREGPHA